MRSQSATVKDPVVSPRYAPPVLRVTTWNLGGLDDRRLDERTEAACLDLLLRDDPPHVVLLQEVVKRAFVAHLRPHFAHAGYAWAPEVPEGTGEAACLILVRRPLRLREAWRSLFDRSQMGRELLGARVHWEGRDLLVTTAHLDSEAQGRAARRDEVQVVGEVLGAHSGPALFAGDTNLRAGEVEHLPGLRDAWEMAGRPAEGRHTWHVHRNRPGRTVRRGFRFDRVWVDERSGWRVLDVRTRGADPVAGGLCPSDHLALEVDLALDDP